MKNKILIVCLDNPIDRRILNLHQSINESFDSYLFSKTLSIKSSKKKKIFFFNLSNIIFKLIYKFFFYLKKLIFKIFKHDYTNNFLISIFTSFLIFIFFFKKTYNLKPDLIIACDQKCLFPCFLYSKILKINFIYDCHELYFNNSTKGFFSNELHSLNNYLMKSASKVFVVNESIKKIYEKKYKLKNITVIKNYVFKEKNKKKIIKLKKNVINLLYVGGFQKNRNLELMLKNLSMFNMKIKWNLYMYGYGEYKNTLKNLVKKLNLNDRVFFKYATPNKLLSYIKNYDLGVIPYSANSLNNKYSLPNKFFEYISAGIPIISNNLIEIKKYAHLRSLILLNVNNIKILEKKIFFLSKNNKFNCNLLKKKALKYTGIYDWHKSYTDYISNQIKINL